jgi:hypothetical protein
VSAKETVHLVAVSCSSASVVTRRECGNERQVTHSSCQPGGSPGSAPEAPHTAPHANAPHHSIHLIHHNIHLMMHDVVTVVTVPTAQAKSTGETKRTATVKRTHWNKNTMTLPLRTVKATWTSTQHQHHPHCTHPLHRHNYRRTDRTSALAALTPAPRWAPHPTPSHSAYCRNTKQQHDNSIARGANSTNLKRQSSALTHNTAAP